MGIFIRWTRLDWSGRDWSTSCTQTIKVSFKKGGYLWVLNWLHLYQLSLICIHWVLSVGKQTSSVFNWALNRMFFFSSLKNRRAFFGGSNFIHADLEMTQDSFGYVILLTVCSCLISTVSIKLSPVHSNPVNRDAYLLQASLPGPWKQRGLLLKTEETHP